MSSRLASLCLHIGCACLWLSLAGPALAQSKRPGLAGYAIGALTDNNQYDAFPRVSPGGLVVWVAGYNLSGAVSGGADREILLWDGATVEQVTDNDVLDERPVVNDAGVIAWTSGVESVQEVFVRAGAQTTQVTADAAPGVEDRYPDINGNGLVVWGRNLFSGWQTSVFDSLTGAPYSVIGPGYRPHVNAGGRIHAAGQAWIVDASYAPITYIGLGLEYGYSAFRRSEINDQDQLALEGDRLPAIDPDFTGPRDILFWDGAQMRLVFRSPGPWHGRPDLNGAGVVVWEGYGGLPGSSSGTADEEIFVYDPTIGQIVQLTDDDQNDLWPTLTEAGVVVWWGLGVYPGASGPDYDPEIFTAAPSADADADGVPNPADNCPLRPNPAPQADGDGDGVGTACQCGDLNDDERTDQADLEDYREWLAGAAAAAPSKCRVNSAWAPCSILDVAVLARAFASPSPLGPGIAATCDAALQW
jgi:hypothetical protein